MRHTHSFGIALSTLLIIFILSTIAGAQSGVSGTIQGTVTDPSGAVVPNATVEISNAVSGLARNTVTDNTGHFVIANVPFNAYHVTVATQGFASQAREVDVRSTVPVNLSFSLKVTGSSEQVTVEASGEDLLEKNARVPHRRGPRVVQ